MNDDGLYYKVFDRRQIGALLGQVDDLQWAMAQDNEYIDTLENSVHRSTFLNNLMWVAFLCATLFAVSFYFLLRQEQGRIHRRLMDSYAAEVHRDKATFQLAKASEKLQWLEKATKFTPTGSDNWWVDNFEVTAYTNSPDEVYPSYDGYTATMTPADWKRNIVAVDPKVVPLRSTMWIKGRGWVRAEDTGGAIKGNRIDILVEKKQDAFAHGRRMNVPVLVVAPHGYKRKEVLAAVEPTVEVQPIAAPEKKKAWYKRAWGWIAREAHAGE